jgi:predicted nucleic acid-binding protein
MSRYVIDASVAIKWFLPMQEEENSLNEAMQLFSLFLQGNIVCYQPPHFIAEMIGVLTRLCPDKAVANLTDLLDMDFQRVENAELYLTAGALSIQLKHHTFDTLYHAVAINTAGVMLITADDAYYRKAHTVGHIVRLQDYAL